MSPTQDGLSWMIHCWCCVIWQLFFVSIDKIREVEPKCRPIYFYYFFYNALNIRENKIHLINSSSTLTLFVLHGWLCETAQSSEIILIILWDRLAPKWPEIIVTWLQQQYCMNVWNVWSFAKMSAQLISALKERARTKNVTANPVQSSPPVSFLENVFDRWIYLPWLHFVNKCQAESRVLPCQAIFIEPLSCYSWHIIFVQHIFCKEQVIA